MRISLSRFILPTTIVVILGVVFLLPGSARAQCGTQASSCKNCHEVQAQDPVNAKGDWHVQHAFGDFCEFCHAGNVTATDKDAAHIGMIYPLSDPKGSCSSCHVDDYQAKAAGYAKTLNVDLASVAGGGQTSATQEATQPAAQEAVEAATQQVAELQVATSGQIVNLNDRYEEFTKANTAAKPINVGNVILSVMLVGLVGAFGGLAWKFEGLDKRWAELRGKGKKAEAATSSISTGSPAIDALIPALQKASPATLASLHHLLATDTERGGHMIEAVARIDPRLVETVRRLNDQDLELLVALVRELKEGR